MAEKKTYKVAVTELFRRIVLVEASSELEAHRRVSDAWQNGEYLLDSRDFEGAEFYVLGESDGEGEKNLSRVDAKNAGADEDGAD